MGVCPWTGKRSRPKDKVVLTRLSVPSGHVLPQAVASLRDTRQPVIFGMGSAQWWHQRKRIFPELVSALRGDGARAHLL